MTTTEPAPYPGHPGPVDWPQADVDDQLVPGVPDLLGSPIYGRVAAAGAPATTPAAAPVDVPLVDQWARTEPVRLYLYGVLCPLFTLLVALGAITESTGPLIGAVAAAVLGVPVTEVVRRNVWSPDTHIRDLAGVR